MEFEEKEKDREAILELEQNKMKFEKRKMQLELEKMSFERETDRSGEEGGKQIKLRVLVLFSEKPGTLTNRFALTKKIFWIVIC